MTQKNSSSFEDLFAEIEKDPGFRKEYRRQKPYYDLVLEIVRRRRQLGLTQKELAAKAGTHQSSISRIESGEHDIQLSTLIQIAEALEATVDVKLVPRFRVSDEDYRKLLTVSADNEPGGQRTESPIFNPELAKV
jgi:transcriptional regulator with XRE-family HTH domain